MKLGIKKKNIIFKSSKCNIKENCKTDSISSTFYSSNYSYTDYDPSLFLDYTFKGNKNKLYNKNNLVNKTKANKYKYELEETFKLNLDILFSYYNELNSNGVDNLNNHNKEILILLNNIKNKIQLKNDTKKLIKQKVNELISRNECNNIFHKKLDNQLNQYNIKIENNIKKIQQSNNYILELKERFSDIEKYIKKIRFNSEGRKSITKKNKLKKFISSNNKYSLKITNYIKDIDKLKSDISEVKKDNKMERSWNRLCKTDKPDINLIRVVEFYLRIIRNISLRKKKLKNSVESLTKTLQFLDLNQIANLYEYKRNRQKSSYEIEFSDLDESKIEKNIHINNYERNFMDLNKILNK